MVHIVHIACVKMSLEKMNFEFERERERKCILEVPHLVYGRCIY